MIYKIENSFSRDFDYEEDDFDRLENIAKKKLVKDVFTNKAQMKKFEFDYEEDAFEPDRKRWIMTKKDCHMVVLDCFINLFALFFPYLLHWV